MSRRAEPGDRLGRGEAGAAGDDEIGVETHDLLDVDRAEGHDVGQRLGLGGIVAGVVSGDDGAAGAHGEQCLGHRWRQRDDPCRLGGEGDRRALVVCHGRREGGRRAWGWVSRAWRCGVAIAAADALGEAEGVLAPCRRPGPGREQRAWRRMARAARCEARDGRTGTAGTRGRPPLRVRLSEGSRRNAKPLASSVSKEGLAGGSHGPAYLSLEGSSMHRGSATGLAPRRAFTVAGLCRDLTGFATTRRLLV